MPLTRSDLTPEDVDAGSVGFVMLDGERPVTCRVSREYLEEIAATAGMAPVASLELFHTFRREIEALAATRYENGGPDGEGLISVGTG